MTVIISAPPRTNNHSIRFLQKGQLPCHPPSDAHNQDPSVDHNLLSLAADLWKRGSYVFLSTPLSAYTEKEDGSTCIWPGTVGGTLPQVGVCFVSELPVRARRHLVDVTLIMQSLCLHSCTLWNRNMLLIKRAGEKASVSWTQLKSPLSCVEEVSRLCITWQAPQNSTSQCAKELFVSVSVGI